MNKWRTLLNWAKINRAQADNLPTIDIRLLQDISIDKDDPEEETEEKE